MVEHNVIDYVKNDGIMTALVKLKNATYQPFVVAYAYDPETKTWGQGHYFCEFRDAYDYYVKNY